ncbi:DNA-directed DNA polymerase [Friedmanniomyces endolithicus]|uniref:DNA-directed DNA polymerase n=1 Tax=Friedmanniomyces endolithicus TaxID=329885 RepID=A0AAN6K0Q9_9PEZI|nr:DNA-directed DNA polymerase [Friedmanniomyces endolithicus]KAK0952876.1 DNA-directed DNA polymerase [Friedmanniomyces endolithicus]KAK0953185.1 DNA-directed DNA polymerase [Friedmanniomyces endolithicus]KAK1044428.1 DNA-directed DNA polymerase [Friedmanniomyces endolithicus]
MVGLKRPRAEDSATASEGVHPSRKRRLDHVEANTALAQAYNDLADEIPSVRLRGAGDICKYLTTESPDQAHRTDAALDRLVKGLCSGRKAARLGFSVALSEVLRLAFSQSKSLDADDFTLAKVAEKCIHLTRPEGKAILQSNIALREDVPDVDWELYVKAILDLACHKDWLRTECSAMLYEYLDSGEGTKLTLTRVQGLVDALRQAKLLKTAEGVALWLAISERWPEALPKGVWAKKSPMSVDEQNSLKKILLGRSEEEDEETTNVKTSQSGTRQSHPSFVWKALLNWLYQRNVSHDFELFWHEIVERGLLHTSASTERKALGLQVVALAVSGALPAYLGLVLNESIVRLLTTQRSENSRYLFDAAKQVLDSIVARAKLEPEVAPRMMHALLAGGAFDQQTKTKTIESMLQRADETSLEGVVATFRMVILRPRVDSEGQVDARRRAYADILLNLIRLHKNKHSSGQFIAPWLKQVLQLLVDLGYRDIATEPSPPLADATRTIFRSRLTSCVSLAMDQPAVVVAGILTCILDTLAASWKSLSEPLSKQAKEVLRSAEQARKDIAVKIASQSVADATAAPAFDMLFGLSMLQVYNREADSVEALADLQESYDAWEAGAESSTGVVELLLSFVSKPSASLRKLAERTFAVLAGNVTAESLRSFVDILQQQESLSGQQQLFEQQDDGAEIANGDIDDDGDKMEEIVDVEDESDMEIVNGDVANASGEDDEEDSDPSSDSGDGADGSAGEDEEAIFDRKLADALGTAGMEEADADSDGSDMDDEQMMALEPHLATIFKERSKIASKKQDNKDAKENIVNFKNRVLDLLAIYVKSQYGNTIAMDIILPLTSLVRTTSSKPTAEKAFAVLKQYFEACNKNKSPPIPEDDAACFAVLSEIHEEVKLGGSKLHANACSRSSLFLSKVLVAKELKHYKRISKMYGALQREWYMDPKSKVHGSVFTEWTSWSLATRKQR